MVASFGIARLGDDLFVSLPEDQSSAFADTLAKFLPFFGCTIDPTDWVGGGSTEPSDGPICIDLGNGLYEVWGTPGTDSGWAELRIQRNLPWVTAATVSHSRRSN